MPLIKSLEIDTEGFSGDNVKFHPTTGISVLVVGAGIGGVMAALECKRQGHDVRVIERTANPSTAGDFFTVGSHTIRHFQIHWPDLAKEIERTNYEPWASYHKITGERWAGPEPLSFADLTYTHPDGSEREIRLNRHSRPKLIKALLAQAKSIGIDIAYGQQVAEYTEDEATQKAGVILSDGSKLEADVVVAADGVGTKSHKIVSGHEIRAYPSGFAIYRTAFPIELAISDPEIAQRWPLLDGARPSVEIWQGDNMCFFVQRYQDTMSWLMTHKGDNIGMETWSQYVDASKALEITSKIPGFPEIAERLISKTPKDGIIDWELMWRDPQENWVSPLGRVVQLGDSAHTFLPSSGNGATQAIEDAISLAACLQIGGKCNISRATKIHNKLRFQRVICIQLMGFVNHQRQNNANLNAVDANGKPLQVKIHMGRWIMHDPEGYAFDNYGKVLNQMLNGTPFESTNIPPGYTYKPWTIQELFDVIQAGQPLRFEGDWF